MKPSAAETEKRFNGVNAESRGRIPLRRNSRQIDVEISPTTSSVFFFSAGPPSACHRGHRDSIFPPLIRCAATCDGGRLSAPRKHQSAAAWLTLSRAPSGSDSDAASRPGGLAVNSHSNGQLSFLGFFFCRGR